MAPKKRKGEKSKIFGMRIGFKWGVSYEQYDKSGLVGEKESRTASIENLEHQEDIECIAKYKITQNCAGAIWGRRSFKSNCLADLCKHPKAIAEDFGVAKLYRGAQKGDFKQERAFGRAA